MKRVVIDHFGGPEVVSVVDRRATRDRVRPKLASGSWPPACHSAMLRCAPARIPAARSRRSLPVTNS